MNIQIINDYHIEVDGFKSILRFTGTKKQLTTLLEEFMESLTPEEEFRPVKFIRYIKSEGYGGAFNSKEDWV